MTDENKIVPFPGSKPVETSPAVSADALMDAHPMIKGFDNDKFMTEMKSKLAMGELFPDGKTQVTDFLPRLLAVFDTAIEPLLRGTLGDARPRALYTDYGADDYTLLSVLGDRCCTSEYGKKPETFASCSVIFAVPGLLAFRTSLGWDPDQPVAECRAHFEKELQKGLKSGFERDTFQLLATLYDGDFTPVVY